jgi:hypothetical protein
MMPRLAGAAIGGSVQAADKQFKPNGGKNVARQPSNG